MNKSKRIHAIRNKFPYVETNTSYKDLKWINLKKKVFNVYGKSCMKCSSKKNVEVDHIKPKSYHPDLKYKFNNLQVLCKKCNFNKLNKHATDYRPFIGIEPKDVIKKNNKIKTILRKSNIDLKKE